MRRVPGTTGQLVVDLLLVEHRRFTEQPARDVDDGSGAQQRAQLGVRGEEVLAAAELRPVLGRFPVLEHAGRVGERGDLVSPARQGAACAG